MARMIDADRLLRELTALSHGQVWPGWTYDGIRLLIERQPTLTQPKDSTPVQHGRWVKPVPGDGENYCSVCHAVQPWFYGYGYYDSDYCPNCGACMDAKEELKDGKDD